jgi:hypothetical protein
MPSLCFSPAVPFLPYAVFNLRLLFSHVTSGALQPLPPQLCPSLSRPPAAAMPCNDAASAILHKIFLPKC